MSRSLSNEVIERCQLLGVPGLLVQLANATIIISVMIYKRTIEFPKRPWKIFFMDISKQAISANTCHMLNLLIAITMSSYNSGDACVWYFFNTTFDCTLGTLICCFLLKYANGLFRYLGKNNFESGNYYEEEVIYQKQESCELILQKEDLNGQKQAVSEISWKAWILQLLIWNLIVVIGKLILFGIQREFRQPIGAIGASILSWLGYNVLFRLVFVLLICPLLLNLLQFWIQDNFLKKKHQMSNKTTELVFGENPQNKSIGLIWKFEAFEDAAPECDDCKTADQKDFKHPNSKV